MPRSKTSRSSPRRPRSKTKAHSFRAVNHPTSSVEYFRTRYVTLSNEVRLLFNAGNNSLSIHDGDVEAIRRILGEAKDLRLKLNEHSTHVHSMTLLLRIYIANLQNWGIHTAQAEQLLQTLQAEEQSLQALQENRIGSDLNRLIVLLENWEASDEMDLTRET